MAGPASTLAPYGPGAAVAADLWWLMLAVAAAVFLAVMGLLAFALIRGRRAGQPPADAQRLILAGTAATTVVSAPTSPLGVSQTRTIRSLASASMASR
ncbi:MAG TPA: hypothetical protein VGL23_11080 [Chloroflexota bacterium]